MAENQLKTEETSVRKQQTHLVGSAKQNTAESTKPGTSEPSLPTWPPDIFVRDVEYARQFLAKLFFENRNSLYLPLQNRDPCKNEFDRQWSVQRRFFSPLYNPHVQTHDLILHFLKTRFFEERIPLVVEGIHPRHIITAERGVIEMSLTLCGGMNNIGRDSKFPSTRNSLGWILNHREVIQLSSTVISCNFSVQYVYPNHLGNYFMSDVGTYAQILDFFSKLAPEKEQHKKIATMLLCYARTGKAITSQEMETAFQKISPTDVDIFNRIAYHIMVKEVARRMCAEKEYDLPVAIAQTRALKLLEAGEVTLKDVFGLNSPYGVVTAADVFRNNADATKKISEVNRLYNTHILEKKELNRKELHRELRATYPKMPSNDSSDYSDDEETTEERQKKQNNSREDTELSELAEAKLKMK